MIGGSGVNCSLRDWGYHTDAAGVDLSRSRVLIRRTPKRLLQHYLAIFGLCRALFQQLKAIVSLGNSKEVIPEIHHLCDHSGKSCLSLVTKAIVCGHDGEKAMLYKQVW